MMQNGSSQGAWTVPSHSHQEYMELYALSTTGELTAEEWLRLEEHLSHCDDCKEIKQQYEHVVATIIPVLGAAFTGESGDEDSRGSWSAEHAEEALMKSLDREPHPAASRSVVLQKPDRSQRFYRYAAAPLLLGVFTFTSYRIGVQRRRRLDVIIAPQVSPVLNAQPRLNHSDIETVQTREKTEPEADKPADLRHQNRLNLLEVTRLKETKGQLENELAQRNADLSRSILDRAELDRQLALAQSDTQSLQEKLSLMEEQNPQTTGQEHALETQVNGLNAALQEKDKEIAQEQDLLQHDRDIRNLIGARDLYIAEIYDIAKTGDTQKPFGRVFYTKDKSLVFYGYDLDQQPGIKNASTFQAWGRRGSDQQHDVSLGLLYLDDANKKRWVLKSHDATTLARIDAIFVTVEPKGGSARPSGKPLLFTYLRLDPNHP